MLRLEQARYWSWSSSLVEQEFAMEAAAAVCPICGGTGWKIIERAGLSGATPCRCAEEARAGQLQEGSGIPPNYARATLDNSQIPQDNPIARTGLGTVLMQVRSFVREFPNPD